MAVMNRHVCPVENWYGALCRQLTLELPSSVPSWALCCTSRVQALGLELS